MDKKVVSTLMQKGMNLRILKQQEKEKDITKLFHIEIQVKKTKIDAIFNSISQGNLIIAQLFNKLGLEVQDHPSPYLFRWVYKYVEIKVTKKVKSNFLSMLFC